MEEVEQELTLAHILLIQILVRLQFHHLVVIEVGSLLRVHDLDIQILAGRLEQIYRELSDILLEFLLGFALFDALLSLLLSFGHLVEVYIDACSRIKELLVGR